MNAIDLTPLYRSSIGFDRLASLLNHTLNTESTTNGYPPYNIEVLDEKRYSITLALAGFTREELELQVENNVLTVKGGKQSKEEEKKYLYQGIANRTFERKFSLADHVEVTGADLSNGLLTIKLVKEIPESMKPRMIAIGHDDHPIEHDSQTSVSNQADDHNQVA